MPKRSCEWCELSLKSHFSNLCDLFIMPKCWTFFYNAISAIIAQLVGCPLCFAIQPLTNQTINSLFVIYTIPYKSSNTNLNLFFCI
jgi:hypothetical protein